jgi:hypothetical protein
VTEPTERRDERRLAVWTGSLLATLAVVAVAVGGALGGTPAALSALIGVGLTAVLFGVSVLLLAWAAERGKGAAIGLFTVGASFRLGFYLLALEALAFVAWIDRPSLAIATAVSLAITLLAELVWMSRMPRLFWIDTGAATAPASAHATRS